MFKKILFFIMICSLFTLFGCQDETSKENPTDPITDVIVQPTDLTFTCDEKVLDVKQKVLVNVVFIPLETTDKEISITSSNESIVSVEKEDNTKMYIVGVSIGKATITCEHKTTKLKKLIKVEVIDKENLKITSPTDLTIEEEKTINLDYDITGIVSPIVDIEIDDDTIISIKDNVITGLSVGTATIRISLHDYKNVFIEVKVTVTTKPILATSIEITSETDYCFVNNEIILNYSILPSDAVNKEVVWSSDDLTIATVSSSGVVTGLKEGTVKITCQIVDSKVKDNITIYIEEDTSRPVISIDEAITTKDTTINYGEDFDPMVGIIIKDNCDNSDYLKENVEISNTVDTSIRGSYTLEYVVTDKAGNKSRVFSRVITVIWNYDITFIGHGGCIAGVFNTEEAFINAATVYGYQALECDLKQTSDGIFVLCHDDTFAGVSIANTRYNELADVVATSTRDGVTYSSKICTLETYLDICKRYNCLAVIELKSSNGITASSTTRMQALMDVISKKGMLKKVAFLGSQWNCLKWTRDNGYDYIPCQYLVTSINSDTYYQRCIDNKFDISFNISGTNTQEWIDKYHEAGCKVSCYTFSIYQDKEDLQKFIDMNVDFVTVDKIKPNEVTLPIKETE